MFAGQLDRRVTIQTKQETTDDFGQTIVTWVDKRTLWAGKFDLVGSEFFEAGAENSEVETDWKLRWQPNLNLTAETRIKERDGTTHEVVTPPMEIGRREGLKLRTRRVV